MRKTNIICATSCASESAFSIAGYIQRRNRSSLSSQVLRYSIMCKDAAKIEEIKL